MENTDFIGPRVMIRAYPGQDGKGLLHSRRQPLPDSERTDIAPNDPAETSRVWWLDDRTMLLDNVAGTENEYGVFIRFADGAVYWLDLYEWLPDADPDSIVPEWVCMSEDRTEVVFPTPEGDERIPTYWIRMLCDGKARLKGQAWTFNLAESWGIRIRQARVALLWRQADLARRAGTSQSAISRLEAGKRIPRPGTLDRIARCMGLTSFELASGRYLFTPEAADTRSAY